MSATSEHLVDEWEAAFQNCLSALTSHEHMNVTDTEETKTSVDLCIQKYMDVAKQLESFFLQKRLVLSIHKPEQIITEDMGELRQELQRKDALIAKHTEKLQQWQNMLSRSQSSPQGMPPTHPPGVSTTTAAVAAAAAAAVAATPQGVPQHSTVQPGPMAQGQLQMGVQTPPVQAMPPPGTAQGAFLQGPLAYLQQTTSSIGMPERR